MTIIHDGALAVRRAAALRLLELRHDLSDADLTHLLDRLDLLSATIQLLRDAALGELRQRARRRESATP
jgi:hypothetical protein